jgi:hypothetical protein
MASALGFIGSFCPLCKAEEAILLSRPIFTLFFLRPSFGSLSPIELPPSLDNGLSMDVFLSLFCIFDALIRIAFDRLFLTLTFLDLSMNSWVDLNSSSTSSK